MNCDLKIWTQGRELTLALFVFLPKKIREINNFVIEHELITQLKKLLHSYSNLV